jgi:hypothetical protein
LTAVVAIAAVGWAADPPETGTAAKPIKEVAVITDANLDGPGRHGVRKLQEALAARGITVSEGEDRLGRCDFVLLAGLGERHGAAAAALAEMKLPAPSGPEALAIHKGAVYHGKWAIVLAGSDGTGLMYAALDMADRVRWAQNADNPFRTVQNAAEQPYLKERGVVMFTMNRAYFESRLLDERYLVRYFDMLAKERFNRLVLVFGYEDGGYMAPLYPYFFDVDGFPDVNVVGLTRDQQATNLKAFKTMLRLASERGIRVKPGIWEHIYRGGGQAGANPWASKGDKATDGLVWGLNSENLVPYTVAALKKFYQVFPEFTETQFRMHEESGLRRAEIEPFWHAVFKFFRESKPDIRLEFRAKGLPKSVIKDAQSQGLKIQLDTKIWMEQMGLPYHPTHINRENQQDARQSYADLLEYPQTYHMNWTLWNGGTTRVLLWCDPDYARRLVESARLYDGQSLIVTETQATKMLGAPHEATPRDFLNSRYRSSDYEFERYWAFYRVFGRLSYNPRATSAAWDLEYVARFGQGAGPHVMNAVQLASRVLPRIVAASVPYSMFPTTSGWPEMMHLGSLRQYARQQEGSDIQQFMNVRDEATSILEGTDTAMRRPEQTSAWFARTSDAILNEVAAAEQSAGGRESGNEFKSTMTDVKMLAALARYHEWRLLGGVNYNLYRQAGNPRAFDEAVEDERKAVRAWHDLVEAAGDFYVDDMWFGPSGRSFPHHWKDEMKALDTEFDALLAERKASVARPDARPVRIAMRDDNVLFPVVTFEQGVPAAAAPGQEFTVRVKVIAPAGMKWIRLRYRHVNQKEDYQTSDMLLGDKSGSYVGTIPTSFIDPKWDLMFFVEIVDQKGVGRMYPNLEVETPYIVTAVKGNE